AARRAGYRIVPLAQIERAKRNRLFADVWNECFAKHWGIYPFSVDEVDLLFASMEPTGLLDTSLFAYQDEEPVGVLWVMPEISKMAATAPGRHVRDDEKLNFLGIGVRAPARGRGGNLAMAAYSHLALVRRGPAHVSYHLVLDEH